MKNTAKRIELFDELRGFAIAAMIVHHFFLDLGMIYMSEKGYEIFNRLCVFQPIFWAIFIVISGICTQFSRNCAKRGVVVCLCAAAVTIVTAVIMPKIGIEGAEIYFGILHCLGICMILAFFLKPVIAKIKPFTGFAVCIFLFIATYNVSDGTLFFNLVKLPSFLYRSNVLMPFGFYDSNFESADYFALIPWLFMFLSGAFIGEYIVAHPLPAFAYKRHSKVFAFIGRNSLWFYLGHQLVIYAVLYAVLYISIFIAQM